MQQDTERLVSTCAQSIGEAGLRLEERGNSPFIAEPPKEASRANGPRGLRPLRDETGAICIALHFDWFQLMSLAVLHSLVAVDASNG